MDSATRAALLAAMAGPAEGDPVASVAKLDSPLATAEARTNPPFVASVAMLPAKDSNPPQSDPRVGEGWPEQETPPITDTLSDPAEAGDQSIFVATLATWQQPAEPCGSPLLPSKNLAGNAGNKPAETLTPWRFAGDAGDVIEWAEPAHGGKIGLTETGCTWIGPSPPAELLGILKARRDGIRAWLLEGKAAARARRRRQSDWTPADWMAYFHERAGIRSADPTQPDAEAERLALVDCAAHWQALNCPPAGEPGNGCWQCGGFGHAEADPLTSRVCRGGVFWLHPRCWADYDQAAQAEASAAMVAIFGGRR